MTRLRNNSNGAMRGNRALVRIIAELETKGQALKASEVAILLQVTPQHVYKLAAQQIIPSFRVGRAVRFDPDQVASWLQRKMPRPVSSGPEIRVAV
jgi:excisionase family DNA binding protein